MSSKKILLTAATGFVGGTVLTKLVESGMAFKHEITALVRGEDKAKILQAKLGINTIVFKSLDEYDLLRDIASQNDIIIHTASSQNVGAAKAFVLGLGDRKNSTGNQVHYIHQDGTSTVGDQPISGKYHEPRIFSDNEEIYTYIKQRQATEPYEQRTADVAVVETGLQVGVPTTILTSPTIYGVGSGLFNRTSMQAPVFARAAIKEGQVSVVGNGEGIWDHVHVLDLADLYLILLNRILNGEEIPTGKQGFIFSGEGRFAWKDLSKGIAEALYDAGVIKTKELKSITVEDAASKWTGGSQLIAELALASNSRTVADVAAGYGWKPKYSQTDFEKHFADDVKIFLHESY